MSQLLTIEYTCDKAVHWATESLENAGLQVANSFNLQSARATLVHCTCPHHGTADCDCQMVVLLVYGSDGSPATLVAHGHDGQTWLSLVETPEQRPSPQLKESIEMALKPHAPIRPVISTAVTA
jgi:hypothetical protein